MVTNEKLHRISAGLDFEAHNTNGSFLLDEAEIVQLRRLSVCLRIGPEMRVQSLRNKASRSPRRRLLTVWGGGKGRVGREGAHEGEAVLCMELGGRPPRHKNRIHLTLNSDKHLWKDCLPQTLTLNWAWLFPGVRSRTRQGGRGIHSGTREERVRARREVSGGDGSSWPGRWGPGGGGSGSAGGGGGNWRWKRECRNRRTEALGRGVLEEWQVPLTTAHRAPSSQGNLSHKGPTTKHAARNIRC